MLKIRTLVFGVLGVSIALGFFVLGIFVIEKTIPLRAVEYNRAVEKAANSLLLLNILRARDGHPMYFTLIEQIRGQQSLFSTGEISIPWGGSIGSDFVVGSLDHQDFMRGILSPIEKSVLKSYIDQEWPRDLLLYLFVSRVDQTGMNRPQVNSPRPRNAPGYTGFENFQGWVEEVRNELRIGTLRTGRSIGPSLILKNESSLEHLLEAEKLGVQVVGIPRDRPTNYRLCKIETSVVLCIGECPNLDPESMCREGTELYRTREESKAQAMVVKDGKILGKAHLRSVQGILYYLGEVLRYQYESGERMLIRGGTTVLFDLTTNEKEADTPIISVDYNHETWYVAAPRDGKRARTKIVLSLLSQLLALQKK